MPSERVSALRQRYRRLSDDDRVAAKELARVSAEGAPPGAGLDAARATIDWLRTELAAVMGGVTEMHTEDVDALTDANGILNRIVQLQKDAVDRVTRARGGK